MNNETERLVDTVARLNPDAGEIGAGMLATIVAMARRIQASKQSQAVLMQRLGRISRNEGMITEFIPGVGWFYNIDTVSHGVYTTEKEALSARASLIAFRENYDDERKRQINEEELSRTKDRND